MTAMPRTIFTLSTGDFTKIGLRDNCGIFLNDTPVDQNLAVEVLLGINGYIELTDLVPTTNMQGSEVMHYKASGTVEIIIKDIEKINKDYAKSVGFAIHERYQNNTAIHSLVFV